jgi:hypothetical protein
MTSLNTFKQYEGIKLYTEAIKQVAEKSFLATHNLGKRQN